MTAAATSCPCGVMATGSPHNPFARSSHDVAFVFPPPLSADSLLARLGELGGLAQVLGAEGRGKTTLLRTLARHLRARGGQTCELRCDGDVDLEAPLLAPSRRPTAATPRLACLDEADALRPARRRRLVALAEGQGWSLVLASHRDLRLPTLLRCDVEEGMARPLVADMLRRCPQAPPLVAAGEIDEALARRGGNLREALALMYDWYEERWARQRGRQSWAR